MKKITLSLLTMLAMQTASAQSTKYVFTSSQTLNTKPLTEAGQAFQLNRTLLAGYNTICLPVSLDAEQLQTAAKDVQLERLVSIKQEGDVLNLAGLTIRVLHTPGHTPGSVCLIAGDSIFSGDTLFQGSLGRTDLGGDMAVEINSIRTRILTLPPQTKVYPGHGPSTTVEWEQKHNPYVRSR